MPVNSGVTIASLRKAAETQLFRRRKRHGALLLQYKEAMSAHEEYKSLSRVMREAMKKRPPEMPKPSVRMLTNGSDAAKLLWTIAKTQRRWRRSHPWAVSTKSMESRFGGLAISLSLQGRPSSYVEISMIRRTYLLEKGAHREPVAPPCFMLLSKDEIDEVIYQAQALKKKGFR